MLILNCECSRTIKMEIEKKCPLYLYPIYFDASKTVSEGRRVPKSLAKSNPQPKDILAALTQQFGLAAELEKVRYHPVFD